MWYPNADREYLRRDRYKRGLLSTAGIATTGWQGDLPRAELLCNPWARRKQLSGAQTGHRKSAASVLAHGHEERVGCHCRQEAWNIPCPCQDWQGITGQVGTVRSPADHEFCACGWVRAPPTDSAAATTYRKAPSSCIVPLVPSTEKGLQVFFVEEKCFKGIPSIAAEPVWKGEFGSERQ